jgi:branched-chain amino acid transport system ATP-binding protein
MTNMLLNINQLTGTRDGHTTIQDITLDLKTGKSMIVLGANGSGKTTFLRSIMGLEKISTGTIKFLGHDIKNKPTRKRAMLGIGYCPEGRRLFPGLTVWETLAVAFNGTKTERKQRIHEIFTLLPALKIKKSDHAWSLSGGQQQMLAIARAIINKPKLVLLDEPTLGLSPMIITEVMNIIRSIIREGATIIMAEQRIESALMIGDLFAVFSRGRIIHKGLVNEIDRDQIASMVISGKDKQPF